MRPHEVGRHGNLGREAADRLHLIADKIATPGRHEPFPIDDQPADTTVDVPDLIPCRVGVAPEVAPIRFVERVERAVFRLQPLLERAHAEVAIAVAVVFIGDMPERQRGMLSVALRQLLVDGADLLPVDGRGEAMVVAAFLGIAHALGGDAADFGILERHPVGLGAAGSGQDDIDPLALRPRENIVHPGEIVAPFLGFKARPGKDADGDGVDVRLVKKLEVGVDDARIGQPLVRVIVAAVEEGLGKFHFGKV